MTNNAQEEERRKFDEYCEENIMGMLNPEFCFRIWLARAQQPAKASLEWQPIETAPRDGTFILTWHKEGGGPDISRYINGAWTKWAIVPTHWMPLPEIPESAGRGD